MDAVLLGEPVDGTVSDRWRAVEALQQTAKTIGLARGKIETALRGDLGKGKHPLDDGTICISVSRSLTEWNKDAIRSEINRAAASQR